MAFYNQRGTAEQYVKEGKNAIKWKRLVERVMTRFGLRPKRLAAETPAFKRSCDERKKVELAFAHMKRIFKLDRLRLRGLSGARDEVLLTETAQNLRKLARHVCRPPPTLKTA